MVAEAGTVLAAGAAVAGLAVDGCTGVPNDGAAGAVAAAGRAGGSVALGPAAGNDGSRGCVTVPTSMASMSCAVISGMWTM